MAGSDTIRQSAEQDEVKFVKKTHSLIEEEYEAFVKRCVKDGFSASQIIRSFMKLYRAKGER